MRFNIPIFKKSSLVFSGVTFRPGLLIAVCKDDSTAKCLPTVAPHLCGWSGINLTTKIVHKVTIFLGARVCRSKGTWLKLNLCEKQTQSHRQRYIQPTGTETDEVNPQTKKLSELATSLNLIKMQTISEDLMLSDIKDHTDGGWTPVINVAQINLHHVIAASAVITNKIGSDDLGIILTQKP